MIGLSPGEGPLDVLCLGAHPDDIEIGCGGLLLELSRRADTSVTGIVLTGEGRRKKEAEESLPRFFPGAQVHVVGLPDGRLPAHWAEVKEALEGFGRSLRPDVVLAPMPEDAHQDHRLVGRLVTTVWRDSLTLHYEIPKWDGDLCRPTHYVSVAPQRAEQKVDLLNAAFPSQAGRDWWDDELFLGLMRIRGMESRSTYAEAFTAPKVKIDLDSGAKR
jgi:LmbE family N-acetylglucosaminyl deacetylase